MDSWSSSVRRRHIGRDLRVCWTAGCYFLPLILLHASETSIYLYLNLLFTMLILISSNTLIAVTTTHIQRMIVVAVHTVGYSLGRHYTIRLTLVITYYTDNPGFICKLIIACVLVTDRAFIVCMLASCLLFPLLIYNKVKILPYGEALDGEVPDGGGTRWGGTSWGGTRWGRYQLGEAPDGGVPMGRYQWGGTNGE